MTTTERQAEEIIRFLAERGAGSELSVPLLFRMRNLNLNQIASEAGYSRQLLYFALRGDRTAPEPLRRLLLERLGADPWRESDREQAENQSGHTVATSEGSIP